MATEEKQASCEGDSHNNSDQPLETKVFSKGGRRIMAPKQFEARSGVWTETEMKALLKAIPIFGEDDLESLARYLRTKSEDEIKAYLKKLRAKKAKENPRAKVQQAPIEVWLNTIRELLANENDRSHVMGKVLAIATNFEPRDPPSDDDSMPNYGNIYRYLSCMISGEEAIELSPIEAALMLDLLQGLSDQLKTLDTSVQREMMLKKFSEIYSEADKDIKKASDSRTPSLSSSCNQSDKAASSNNAGDPSGKQGYNGQEKPASSASDHSDAPAQSSLPATNNAPANSTAPAATASIKNIVQKPVKRSALFSINPFSIPVKLLKLEKVQTENSVQPEK